MIAATSNQTRLDPVQVCLLQLAMSVARLRAALFVNHKEQERLAAMAAAITDIAKEIESKN